MGSPPPPPPPGLWPCCRGLLPEAASLGPPSQGFLPLPAARCGSRWVLPAPSPGPSWVLGIGDTRGSGVRGWAPPQHGSGGQSTLCRHKWTPRAWPPRVCPWDLGLCVGVGTLRCFGSLYLVPIRILSPSLIPGHSMAHMGHPCLVVHLLSPFRGTFVGEKRALPVVTVLLQPNLPGVCRGLL